MKALGSFTEGWLEKKKHPTRQADPKPNRNHFLPKYHVNKSLEAILSYEN